jgi:integrase
MHSRHTKAFTKIAARLGLSITFHSLRHSQATTLIAAGVPVKVVSERLGHASVGITQDIYTHVLPARLSSPVVVTHRANSRCTYVRVDRTYPSNT